MKFDSHFKEYKYHIGGGGVIIVVIILVIIGIFSCGEFRDEKEGKNNNKGGNVYESRYVGEKLRHENNNKESCEGNKYSNDNSKNESNRNESDISSKINESNKETSNNKIILPLNIISELDASKVATDSNSGSKVTQVSIENENGVVAYSFILDNKNEVTIDAVNGKIINNDNNEQVKGSTETTDTSSGKTVNK